MKNNKFFLILIALPLAVSCSNEINFNFDTPTIDVDTISIGEIHRDALGGEIDEDENFVYFDFYEISDFHGAVNYSVEEKTIGLAKLGDYISKKRAENPGGTILLSSGDMFQGSAESNLTHGYMVNYAMNVMGFESMTIGNHEFDWSIDWLKKIQSLKVDNYSIPFLGANVFDKTSGKILDFLSPSTVINRNNYKIGIIGTLGNGTDNSIMSSLIENLEFKDELEIAKLEASRLKNEEKCDIVVWSSHRDANELYSLGLSKDSGIDAVFGGHSHQNSPAEGEEALIKDGIPFTQTKNYGKGLAHVRLALNKATDETTLVEVACDNEPYIYPNLVNHPEVLKVMDVYNAHINPIKNQVIGDVDNEMEISNSFSLTNLCVDTMQLVANKWGKDHGEIKVIASFHNANGGIRANLPSGEITFGSIYKSFPFDNEICLVKTTGKKVKSLLNGGAAMGTWRDINVLSKWEDLPDDEEVYYAVTDFMATSRNFKFNVLEKDLIRTSFIVRDVIAGRIKSQWKINSSNFIRDDSNPQFKVLNRR